MAKDKQWLVEEITKQLNIYGGKGERMEGFNKGLEFVLGMVEELEEPEKPMIPQFIADRIEEYKELQFGISLIFMINRQIDDDVRFSKWLSSDKNNCDKVARGFLDGYAITPENKMQITVKSYDKTELKIDLPEKEAKKLIDKLKKNPIFC